MRYNRFVKTVKLVPAVVRKVVAISAVGLLLFPTMAFSKTKSERYNNVKARAKYKQRHSGNDDALYADGIKIKKDLFMIDKTQLEREIAADAIPADKLYGEIWNNDFVNCYKSMESFPDSFRVNLKGFTMPTMGYTTSNYGPRGHRHHYGIDLKVQIGDTIYAAFDGKVRVRRYEGGGYGYFLTVRHPNGLETVYGHLSQFLVSENQNVKSGQPIALGGSTGRSTGPHLHFETRFLGRPIDPSRIIDFDNKECHRDYYVVNSSSFSPLHSSSTEVYYAKSNSNNKYTKGNVRYHRVVKGDTLAEIAQKNGVTVKKLCSLNKITKRTKLRPGKTLRLS
jgi:murein DD-endopeptidase MepM/ murein hydrolase activator NlpD